MPHQADYEYVADILDLNKTLIPVPPHQLAQLSDPECLVCRDEPEDPVELPCSCRYVFCRTCITLALARKDACPLCQTAMPSPLPWMTTQEKLLAHTNVELRFFLRSPRLALGRALVGNGSLSWAEVFIAALVFTSLRGRDAYSPWNGFALSLLLFYILLRESHSLLTLFNEYDQLTPRRGLLQRASFSEVAQSVELYLDLLIWTACCIFVGLLLSMSAGNLIMFACQSFGCPWSATTTAFGIPERHVLYILAMVTVQTATRSTVVWLANWS